MYTRKGVTRVYVKGYRRRTVGYRPYTNPYTKTSATPRSHVRYYANQQYAYIPPATATSTYTYSKSKTGNYLRNWRNVVRQGGNATTSFSAWEHVLKREYPRFYIWNQWRASAFSAWQLVYSTDNGVSFLHASLAPFSAHFIPGVTQKAQDRAASAVTRKVHQAHHQLQGGVILGEIDKTARLLTGTAKKLKQGVFQYIDQAVGIRRGRGTKLWKNKQIASTYLEATFGWSPLIHDAEDFAKTLARLTVDKDRVRFRAGAEWEEQYSQEATTHQYGNLFFNRNILKTTRSNIMYRGFLQGLPYEAGSPPLERIISMSGFDWRSFVPTMWELVPYSFLVDYFTNIGECLQSWTLDRSVVKQLWRTEVTESTVEVRMTPDLDRSLAAIKSVNGTNGQNYTYDRQGGCSTVKYRTVSRAAAEMPLLVPQLTGLDLPWRQFANIGALLLAKMR